MSLSLISIMRDDPEFGKRITKKVQEIKKDKESLLNVADQYGERYQQEILEGTLHRANLLTEGKAKGLSEDEVMAQHGRFVPTVYTPILNLLYFLLRESEVPGQNKYGRRDNIDQQLLKANMLEHKEEDITERDIDSMLDELEQSIYTRTKPDDLRRKVNEQFAEEKKSVSKEDATKLKDTPDMVNFLYGSLTLDQFNVLKKLKALAQSSNISEATAAFRKCRELCAKYELDYDRIPCYVKSKE